MLFGLNSKSWASLMRTLLRAGNSVTTALCCITQGGPKITPQPNDKNRIKSY